MCWHGTRHGIATETAVAHDHWAGSVGKTLIEGVDGAIAVAGHNIKVGKNCLITAGIIVAGSSIIGDNCVFAGRVSVNGHIEITSNCQFGPLTAITNDIREPGVYAGFPPIPIRDFLKSNATLVHLPKMRKNLSRIMKHLGLHDDEKSTTAKSTTEKSEMK